MESSQPEDIIQTLKSIIIYNSVPVTPPATSDGAFSFNRVTTYVP
jgi:hypothetical protein